MKKKSAPEIIAWLLGWDQNEVTRGKYQKYINPSVYICGDDYYACTPLRNNKEPAHDVGGPWEIVGEYSGRLIWRSRAL